MNITTGATLSGGSTVALTPAGIQPGRSTFVGPNHTRSNIERVEFSSSQTLPNTKTGAKGQGRVGVRLQFSEAAGTGDGCCNAVQPGLVIDLGIRTDTLSSDTQVTRAIEYLRGVVYTTAFEDAIKKLVLPQS